MMHFSEGPDFYDSDKALDTLKKRRSKYFSQLTIGLMLVALVGTWKDDDNLDYQVWQVIRGR